MTTISFARHQFPPEIIRHTVWLYLRFTLSYRDVEDLLAERGLDVSYEWVRRWVLKFGPLFRSRIRISLCDGASARCSASNRQDQPSASSPLTLPSITLLMSSAILHPAPRSESSEAKRSRRGGLRPPLEPELKLPAFTPLPRVPVTAPWEAVAVSSTDASFEKAAVSVKRHSDIAILVRGGRGCWTVNQI